MSKNKDRQHQHIQPLTPALMNQPEKAPAPSGNAESMGSEARIQHLEAESAQAQRGYEALDAEVRRLRAELGRVSRDLGMTKYDLALASQAARHGAPPDGFEPKTAEGKEALEQVVLLGNIAKEQRARADDEYQRCEKVMLERKALHSDLMVLEQTAAGRAPDIALQTDLGKSAAHALSEALTMLDKMNEQRLEGPALPLNGWASDTARQLVEAVQTHERVLLLGDLLAQLLPHTGEHGQNETASDVLKRILAEVEMMRAALSEAGKVVASGEKERNAMSERMVRIQSAMVARRAPDAESGRLLEDLVTLLAPVAQGMGISSERIRGAALPILLSLVKEWQGMRGFFSEAPLVAVAVRDDGAKGPVRERYSLLVLEWGGRSVQTRVVTSASPWGDIGPYLEQTVRKNLVPGAYR